MLLYGDSEEIGAECAWGWVGRVLVRPHALEWKFSHLHRPPRFPLVTRSEPVHRVAALAGLVGGTFLDPGCVARNGTAKGGSAQQSASDQWFWPMEQAKERFSLGGEPVQHGSNELVEHQRSAGGYKPGQ